jgi:hypothetical protein
LAQYEGLIRSMALRRFSWLPGDGVNDMMSVARAAVAEEFGNCDRGNGDDLRKRIYWIARRAMAGASETVRQNIRVPCWAKDKKVTEISLSSPIGDGEAVLEDVLADEANCASRRDSARQLHLSCPGSSAADRYQNEVPECACIR